MSHYFDKLSSKLSSIRHKPVLTEPQAPGSSQHTKAVDDLAPTHTSKQKYAKTCTEFVDSLSVDCRHSLPLVADHNERLFLLGTKNLREHLQKCCINLVEHQAKSDPNGLFYVLHSTTNMDTMIGSRVQAIGTKVAADGKEGAYIKSFIKPAFYHITNKSVKPFETHPLGENLGDLISGVESKVPAIALLIVGPELVSYIGLAAHSKENQGSFEFRACGGGPVYLNLPPTRIAVLKRPFPVGMDACVFNRFHRIGNQLEEEVAKEKESLLHRLHDAKVDLLTKCTGEGSEHVKDIVKRAALAIENSTLTNDAVRDLENVQSFVQLPSKIPIAKSRGILGIREVPEVPEPQVSPCNTTKYTNLYKLVAHILAINKQLAPDHIINLSSSDHYTQYHRLSLAAEKASPGQRKAILEAMKEYRDLKLFTIKGHIDNAVTEADKHRDGIEEAQKECEAAPTAVHALAHLVGVYGNGSDEERKVLELLQQVIHKDKVTEACKGSLETLIRNSKTDCSVKFLGAKKSNDEEETEKFTRDAVEKHLVSLKLNKEDNPKNNLCGIVRCAIKNNEAKGMEILEESLARSKPHIENRANVKRHCDHVVLSEVVQEAMKNPTGGPAWINLYNESLKVPNKNNGCWASVMKYVNSLHRDTCRHRFACVFGNDEMPSMRDDELLTKANQLGVDKKGKETCFMTVQTANDELGLGTSGGTENPQVIIPTPVVPAVPAAFRFPVGTAQKYDKKAWRRGKKKAAALAAARAGKKADRRQKAAAAAAEPLFGAQVLPPAPDSGAQVLPPAPDSGAPVLPPDPTLAH